MRGPVLPELRDGGRQGGDERLALDPHHAHGLLAREGLDLRSWTQDIEFYQDFRADVLNFAEVSQNLHKCLHPRFRSPSVKRAHRLKTTQKSEQKIENMKLRKGKRSPDPQRQLCENNTTMQNSID